MRLFYFDGNEVRIGEEVLLLEPVKKLKKECKNTDELIKILSYVYFLCDARSDFSSIADEEKKKFEVQVTVGLPKSWKETPATKNMIAYYESQKTIAEQTLDDTRFAINNFRLALRQLSVIGEKATLKDVRNLADIIKQIPELIKNLQSAEQCLSSFDNSITDARGKGKKALFEDM